MNNLLAIGVSLIIVATPLTAMAQQRHSQNENGYNIKTKQLKTVSTYTSSQIQTLIANETAKINQVFATYETTSSAAASTTATLTSTESSDLTTMQTDAQNLSGNTSTSVLLQNLNALLQLGSKMRQELEESQTSSLSSLATRIQTAQTTYQNDLTALQSAESTNSGNLNQLVRQFQTAATNYLQLMQQYDNKVDVTTNTSVITTINPYFATLPTAVYTTNGVIVSGTTTTNVSSVLITDANNSAISESISAGSMPSGVDVAGAAIGNTLTITPILSNGTIDTTNAVTITVQ